MEEELILSPITVITKINEDKMMSQTWQEAHVTLIYKEGRDPMLPQSYRPISLLNVDDKLSTIVMTERFF